jgi:hypothetical protein
MGSPQSSADRARSGRVPLSRQPPIWLMVAVVVASLLPLTMQFNGDVGSAHAAGSLETIEVGQAVEHEFARAAASNELQPHEPAPSFPKTAAAEELVLLETSIADATEDLEPCPTPCDERSPAAEEPETRKTSEDESTARPSRAPLLTKVSEACREGDKKAARSTYRTLPLGDSRRKQMRKACRREGVWIL